ncbi:MAG TPA: ornithine carbamoyltransferase [Ktedonobacteraceae bacterium]|jgi:N-acetylornithine carbamoyltransferase
MKTNLRGRDFISTQEWTTEELQTVLRLAGDLKMRWALDQPARLLADKTLFMLFFFSSTRTRNSFEAGMTRLGGHAIFLDPDNMQISHGDTPREIGKIFSSYGHGIAIRHCDWGQGNRYLREVALHASVPVINMQCDIYHPCQAMADLMTCIEKKGDLKGKKVVMSWAYASSYTKPLSLPQSVIELFTQFGADVTLAHPPEFELMPEVLDHAASNARAAGGRFQVVHDMDQAFAGADIVYPKSWGPLVAVKDPTRLTETIRHYEHWICDQRRMALARSDALYMHCLPADRGLEVTDAVLDGPQSVVYDQAENRMHVQNAIMALTMGGR